MRVGACTEVSRMGVGQTQRTLASHAWRGGLQLPDLARTGTGVSDQDCLICVAMLEGGGRNGSQVLTGEST